MTLPMRNSSEFFQALFSENSSMLNHLGFISLTADCMVLFVVRHFGSTALGSTSESTVELNKLLLGLTQIGVRFGTCKVGRLNWA